jgi:pimeloyl-ACP methyl ester carboxylesterase
MLHSSLSSKMQWTSLIERMSSRFRVIALDLCGYGDNPLPAAPDSFTLDSEVRLVAAHIDRLVEPHVRVHLIGHSYGGVVALRFAQSSRGRVASMALYEPVAFGALDDADDGLGDVATLAESVRCLLGEHRRDDAARTFVDFWSGAGSHASLPDRTRIRIAGSMDKLPLDFQAASGWRPAAGDLARIVAPTLLAAGNRSPAVAQRIVARLAGTLSNCRVITFESGHMGPITDSHLVNPWLEGFVDRYAELDVALPGRRAVVTPASWQSAAD